MPLRKLLCTFGLTLLAATSAWSIPITLNTTAATAPGTLAGNAFAAAAARVGALFTDPINLFLNVDFQALDPGILGGTSVTYLPSGISYTTIRNALIADATSALDLVAVANLPANPLQFLTQTANSSARTLDNDNSGNNRFLALPQATARALGLFSATSTNPDATIVFSSNYSWDYDPSDGITPGSFDFVGVATHEILHALGFVSGVDILDANPTLDLNPYAVWRPLDLFRYSTDSVAQGAGVLDLGVGGTPYFSVDGGATNLGLFSTGTARGDGQQASHWKDNLNLGIMDPTLAAGELAVIRERDLQAMDAIGFNLASVPELDPRGSFVGLTFVLLGLLSLKRRD